MTDMNITDKQLFDALKSVDPDTKRLPPGFRDFARAVLALAAPVAQPYAYIYEYDTPFGLHRQFDSSSWNGARPNRTVAVFTAAPAPAEQPTPEALAALGWQAIECEICGSSARAFPAPNSKPLTPAQRDAVFAAASTAMVTDVNLSWRHAIVNEVERAHGIKEGGAA